MSSTSGAGIKSETYEICEYESLIDMAKEMKHAQVAKLLTQNLKEEQAALKKLEALSKKVKPEQMMSPDENKKPNPTVGVHSKRSTPRHNHALLKEADHVRSICLSDGASSGIGLALAERTCRPRFMTCDLFRE
jgi:hypothetical protein